MGPKILQAPARLFFGWSHRTHATACHGTTVAPPRTTDAAVRLVLQAHYNLERVDVLTAVEEAGTEGTGSAHGTPRSGADGEGGPFKPRWTQQGNTPPRESEEQQQQRPAAPTTTTNTSD